MCDFSKDFNESANAVGISVYTFMEIEKRGSDLTPKPPLKVLSSLNFFTIKIRIVALMRKNEEG